MCSSTRGPGDGAFLGHVPDQHDGEMAAFGQADDALDFGQPFVERALILPRVVGLRNEFLRQTAQEAGGIAALVLENLAAVGVRRLARDAGRLQGIRVDKGGVTADVRRATPDYPARFCSGRRAGGSLRCWVRAAGPIWIDAIRGRRSIRRAWPLFAASATWATMSSHVRASRRSSSILDSPKPVKCPWPSMNPGDRERAVQVDHAGLRADPLRGVLGRA